jgi:hypothetical protein
MTEAYPLAWPDGWPRTIAADRKRGDASFKRPNTGKGWGSVGWTFAAARDALLEEVWRHKPTSVVLSSNFQPGKHGPVEGRRRPEDEGVAIYFQRNGKPYVMASDRYHDAEGNMRSLTLALEAMRQLERHGGGTMMERAYEGFAALPAPKRPHEVLGVSPSATEAEIKVAWRRSIASAHPDQGGTEAAASEINAARDAMLRATR